MMNTTTIHLDEGDVIRADSGDGGGALPSYGYVQIAEDVTIFPRSREACRALIAAFTEAEKHFDHARPLGVPDIDARDAHDGEGIGNG
jgi:hypothetical protein